MNRWLLSAIFLLAGTIIGSSTSFLLVRNTAQRVFESQYKTQCLDKVNMLRQLKSGKATTLADDMEQRLPDWAAGVPVMLSSAQSVNDVLWQVQRYYEESAVAVPDKLRPLLDRLPPRPLTSCEKAEKGSQKTP
jgi:hypothetical protein